MPSAAGHRPTTSRTSARASGRSLSSSGPSVACFSPARRCRTTSWSSGRCCTSSCPTSSTRTSSSRTPRMAHGRLIPAWCLTERRHASRCSVVMHIPTWCLAHSQKHPSISPTNPDRPSPVAPRGRGLASLAYAHVAPCQQGRRSSRLGLPSRRTRCAARSERGAALRRSFRLLVGRPS